MDILEAHVLRPAERIGPEVEGPILRLENRMENLETAVVERLDSCCRSSVEVALGHFDGVLAVRARCPWGGEMDELRREGFEVGVRGLREHLGGLTAEPSWTNS